MHDGAAFIILDITHPFRLGQCDFLGKSLFLKVANGIVVGVSKEVHDIARGFDVVFQVRHEVRAVAFHLLVTSHGTEDDFGKLAALERPVRDATHYLQRLFDYCYRQVRSVVDESRDIILGHLGQLFLENTLKTCEDNKGFPLIVVVHHPELDLAGPLFNDSWLVQDRRQRCTCDGDIERPVKRGRAASGGYVGGGGETPLFGHWTTKKKEVRGQ